MKNGTTEQVGFLHYCIVKATVYYCMPMTRADLVVSRKSLWMNIPFFLMKTSNMFVSKKYY